MMWERSAAARYVVFLWRFRFTRTGKWFVSALFFSAMIGSASVEVPIYQVFCALAIFFVIDRFAGYVMRPNIAVAPVPPRQTTAGEPFSIELSLTNEGRRWAYDVSVDFFGLPASIGSTDPETTLGDLPPGESTTTAIGLKPERRGIYRLPRPRAYSTFPFQLFRDGRCRSEGIDVMVLPRFEPITDLDLPVGARYQPGGIALTSNIGESPEYIGNREYVPGDSVRRLDYRSWARLGRPIVREYQEEYYCRVALVLDTFVSPKHKPGRNGFANLEAAISLSASIADALARGEYLIDLFAAGPELYVFRAGRHTAHIENVLEIVAGIDACRHDPLETISPALADEFGNLSTLVGVFLDWDAARRGLVRAALQRGCAVKVFVVKDGETSEPIEGDEAEIRQLTIAEVQSGALENL